MEKIMFAVLNIMVLGLILGYAIKSARTGVSGKLIRIVSLVVGVILCPLVVPLFTLFLKSLPWLAQWLAQVGNDIATEFGVSTITLPFAGTLSLANGFSNFMLRCLSFILCMALAHFGISLLCHTKDLLHEVKVVGFIDQLGGFVYGIFVSLLLIWILLSIITVFSTVPYIRLLVDVTHQIPCLQYLNAHNPLLYLFIR